MEDDYVAGEAVRIVGLKAVPQYNGSQALLPSFCVLHHQVPEGAFPVVAELAVLFRRGL